MTEQRTFEDDQIVGVIILETKKLHGHTRKGMPIYTFVPLSHHYPMFLVPSNSREKINQLAVIKFVEWKPDTPYPTGTCIRLIGRVDDAAAYDMALLLKNGLSLSKKFTSISKSIALSHQPQSQPRPQPQHSIVVIDPEGSTDRDDGFHIDNERLYVHIADVDQYITNDGPYEYDLRKRITSVYTLCHGVYHMLPEDYATDIASLIKGGPRHVITVIFRLEKDNVKPIFESIVKSTVSVKWALTYEKAQSMLEFQDKVSPDLMYQIYSLSQITGTLDTHKMIEKIMIWTNEAVAKFIFEHDPACNLAVYCPSPPGGSEHIPEELRRFGPRAVYSLDTHGHGMMGLEHYTHFTSPIRRYADLTVHRIVKNILAGISNDPVAVRDSISLINEVTTKTKRYYRDQSILKLTSILNTSTITTTGYIIDFREGGFVSVFIKEFSIVLTTPLFARELLSIWTVKTEGAMIKINGQDGTEIDIDMYKHIDIQLTCFPSELRLNRKVKVCFPVISSGSGLNSAGSIQNHHDVLAEMI
jgi:exoribonuclease R